MIQKSLTKAFIISLESHAFFLFYEIFFNENINAKMLIPTTIQLPIVNEKENAIIGPANIVTSEMAEKDTD